MEKYAEMIDHFKIPIALGLVGIVLIIGGLVFGSAKKSSDYPKESIVGSTKVIKVDN
ncbi:MAG: hypothetical protein AAB863_03020 [Patescibacteria group bacterium]